MKNKLLSVATALLLAGGISSTASAQSSYYDDPYVDGYVVDAWQDYDRDGQNDRYDRYDDRNDVIWDRDGDGMNDRYEYDGRSGYYDRDRDGVPNRYDRYDDRRYYARQRYNAGRYYAPRNYRYVRYNIGSYLPRNYYGSTYWIDYRPYGLYAPPIGYRWNRVGSDAYLVAIRNGLVRDVIYSLFY